MSHQRSDLVGDGEAEPYDEGATVRAAAQGDREAFRILMERHAEIVYRVCYRVLTDPQEAEDATQETFLTAYRSLNTFRGEGTLRGWLSRIASRRSLARRARRRDAVPLEAVSELPDRAQADPVDAALTAERRQALLREVADLPDQQREVITLSYFAELSLSEIAAATGRPLGTVKTHLHRGLERLRGSAGSSGPVSEGEG
ncbi:MAG: sigma-70 family RNA polymerase sigma factor [Chloroflexi bacterium]|nr:sigma-70 family RNA polymerase sigma factor [Chloroflexota bacterium]